MEKNESAFPIADMWYPNGQIQTGSIGMSALAYAAIHLKVTSPDLPGWLNEMIDRSRRDDFARAAMTGLMDAYARQDIDDFGYREVAQESCGIANAMMEESK